MTSCRLVLVADDARLSGSIQAQVRRAVGGVGEIAQMSLEAIRTHPPREPNMLLLLAAGSPVESEKVLRLVQEICLQKLPPVLVILEAGTPSPGRGLGRLDPYVAARLRWPEQDARLVELLYERGVVLECRNGKMPNTIEDVIESRLLWQTPSLLPLSDRIALAAEHDVTVLLTGETGTGKTHLAKLLHDCSPRAKEPFLVVPCGAIPANLVESAFFGHVKGAFTGATERKIGKFEAAGEGTILLDEIDTLPLEQQAGLLRVIETGEYEPVGSNETKVCRARIIVASNWDLDEAVRYNRFRQDLYYRLNVMSFHLPPLRERVQDIAPLARGMVARFNTRFKKDLFDIHPYALDTLEGYSWPGNIRQMENAVQQAVLVSHGGELLIDHLPPQIRGGDARPPVSPSRPDTLKTNREAHERVVILKALADNGFNRSRTAAALDISRVTLYKKMRAYGLLESRSGEED